MNGDSIIDLVRDRQSRIVYLEGSVVERLEDRQKIYVSLIGPLLGFYLQVPDALTKEEARIMCSSDRRLYNLWCSVYTFTEAKESVLTYGGVIIRPQKNAIDYDIQEVLLHREQERERQEGLED